jgi:uncharacterized protein (TIGR03084 family)
MTLIDDLYEEYDELYAFVLHIPESEWREPTAFWRWTTFDQILHLLRVDRFALASMTAPLEFTRLREGAREAAQAGLEPCAQTRTEFGHLSKAEVLRLWRRQYIQLCEHLAVHGATDRLAWFGPEMSVSSMIAARQMDVWAHGQDIYDLLCVRRAAAGRLRNICDLGVRTYGWTFDNRGLERPGPAPAIALAAPSGGQWRWNEGAGGRVAGPAEDFAMVVTQRRSLHQTALVCEGAPAVAWMAIAQCFTGSPADGLTRANRPGSDPSAQGADSRPPELFLATTGKNGRPVRPGGQSRAVEGNRRGERNDRE